MAKKDEIIEDILDNVDDHEKRLKTLENGIKQILELLQKIGGESPPQKNTQPAQFNVKVEYKDLENAVYDGMAEYFKANPQVAGGLDQESIKKVSNICYNNYQKVLKEIKEKYQAEVDKKSEEDDKKRDALGIRTQDQISEWAPEYSDYVVGILRFIAYHCIDVDDTPEHAHEFLRVVGNVLAGITKTPDAPPPTLKAWLFHRGKQFKANNRKRKGFFYVVLLLLGLASLVFINEYQSAVMDLDRTNRIFYKNVILNERRAKEYHELDSLIHSNSFFKTYRTLDD